MEGCKCDEGKINEYEPDGIHYRIVRIGLNSHNCEYVRRRNLLIPAAERLTENTGGKFLRCMDVLAKETGLVR